MFFSELGMLCSFLCIFLVLVEMRAWRAGTDLRLRLLCSWTLLPVPLACVWLCLFKMGREVQSPLSRCCCCHGAVVGTPCRRQQHRGGGQGLYQDSSSTAALLLAGFGFLLGKLEGTRCDSRCQAEPAGWAEET